MSEVPATKRRASNSRPLFPQLAHPERIGTDVRPAVMSVERGTLGSAAPVLRATAA